LPKRITRQKREVGGLPKKNKDVNSVGSTANCQAIQTFKRRKTEGTGGGKAEAGNDLRTGATEGSKWKRGEKEGKRNQPDPDKKREPGPGGKDQNPHAVRVSRDRAKQGSQSIPKKS